ncbi:hypothetical protein GGR50DRAFT_701050 [Xylaria sp. CBS 124048]|nr:hypothetical protein GGR50DRAFT_701050 [Xylaria sp. CBS 124048]
MSGRRIVAIIGGTGAQGIPVVRDLAQSSEYAVRVLTRDTESPRFKELQAYGPVEGVAGTFASEENLRVLFKGAWGAFAWEIALESGVKFYVHGNIDFAYKKSGFQDKYHCGHYDAKGRMGEYFLALNKDPIVRARMRTALFTTSPYMEMTIAKGTPVQPSVEDGIATWRAPIADGAIPFTALDDCGAYVKWLFDNCDGEADGLDLEVAIAHITFREYTEAFTKVTGKPAQWIDGEIDPYLTRIWGAGAERPAGYNADPSDPATMSMRRNFNAWFTLWQNCGGPNPVLARDYAMLDRIHPTRVRSAEQWLRIENEKGLKAGLGSLYDRIHPEAQKHVLRVTEDGRKGTL